MNPDPPSPARAVPFPLMRKICLWLLVAVLVWAPFPLGGAMFWAAGVQNVLIALCCGLWILSSIDRTDDMLRGLKPVWLPLGLAVLVLLWAWVQILPIVPERWAHPLWAMTGDILAEPVSGVISLDPWRTQAELLKLMGYVMACWMAFDMARTSERAGFLLNAVIAVVTGYAVYGFILALAGYGQRDVFYALPDSHAWVTGPFVLHNSFATYCGLGTLAAMTKLVVDGSQSIVATRGVRPLALSLMQFVLGRGIWVVLAAVICFAGVVASASRAGFASTSGGLLVLAVAAIVMARHGATRRWAAIGAVACVLPLLLLILLNGDTLSSRVDQLLDPEVTDQIRLSLWEAARRMIADAPWLGLGLGSFQDAYPLYAVHVYPFVMDKAHCDYLEFAAGVGLPAAIAWWGAMVWLSAMCLRGYRNRRRNRHFPLIGFAACVLIAIHSSVDFSLQLPAVSLLYAVVLGVAVAQSQSSPKRRQPR